MRQTTFGSFYFPNLNERTAKFVTGIEFTKQSTNVPQNDDGLQPSIQFERENLKFFIKQENSCTLRRFILPVSGSW